MTNPFIETLTQLIEAWETKLQDAIRESVRLELSKGQQTPQSDDQYLTAEEVRTQICRCGTTKFHQLKKLGLFKPYGKGKKQTYLKSEAEAAWRNYNPKSKRG